MNNAKTHEMTSINIIKSYDDLPLVFNPKVLAQILGISEKTAYTLVKEEGFPSRRIGRRWIVNKIGLIKWLEQGDD